MQDEGQQSSFERLARTRAKLIIGFCGALLSILAFNLLLLSTWSDFGRQPWLEGSQVSVALASIIASIVLATILGMIYIRIANSVLDGLAKAAREELDEERGR